MIMCYVGHIIVNIFDVRSIIMSSVLNGFSVEKKIIDNMNEKIPKGYRFKKIRQYIRDMQATTTIKAREAKSVIIYPIRIDEEDKRKIHDIVTYNNSIGNKITSSDVISFIIEEVIEKKVRIRNTTNTSFTIDKSVYIELIKVLKGSTINLTFEEYVIHDYKHPDIKYILSHKPKEKKTMPMLIDKSVLKIIDSIKEDIIKQKGKKISRSDLFRDIVNQMIFNFSNSEEEVVSLQKRILEEFDLLNRWRKRS